MDIGESDRRSAALRPGKDQGITVRVSARGTIELDRSPCVPCLIWTRMRYWRVIHIGDMDISRRTGTRLPITHGQLEAQRYTSRTNQWGEEGRLGLCGIRECHRWTAQLLPEVGQRFRIRVIARTGVERDQTGLRHGLIQTHQSDRRMVDILDRDIDCRRYAAEVSITDDELKTQRTPSDRNARRHESWMDWIAQIQRDCRSGQLGPRILQ